MEEVWLYRAWRVMEGGLHSRWMQWGCGSVGDGGLCRGSTREDCGAGRRAAQGQGQEAGGATGLAALTRDRVSRLPAALWYRSGLPNCSSSQRILQSMLASSFSSISFLGGTWGSGPHTPPPCQPSIRLRGAWCPGRGSPTPN